MTKKIRAYVFLCAYMVDVVWKKVELWDNLYEIKLCMEELLMKSGLSYRAILHLEQLGKAYAYKGVDSELYRLRIGMKQLAVYDYDD